MESEKKFLHLTNQLGTFFSKRRNYFLSSQVVGIEKGQKLSYFRENFKNIDDTKQICYT